MWCVAWFGTICLTKKNLKNAHDGVLSLAFNFTKSNTPQWVFFTFFKLYKWYQIAQNITHGHFVELDLEMVLVANISLHLSHYFQQTLHEKCPNTESFLVLSPSFPYSVRMRENTGQKLLRIWTLYAVKAYLFICSTHHSNYKL